MIVQLLTQGAGGPVDHAVDVAVELHRRHIPTVVMLEDGSAAARLQAFGVRHAVVSTGSKRDVRGLLGAAKRLRQESPKVLHCQDRRAGLIGRTLRRVIRAEKVFYTLHGVPDSLSGRVTGNLQVAPLRKRDEIYYRRAERLLAKSGDAVIVPSLALRDYALSYVGLSSAQIQVIPNGVDLERFRPRDRARVDGRLTVTWIGLLNPVKRIDVLLRAVARVEAVALQIAGTGVLESRMRDLAEELGIAERVQWLGWVGDPERLMGEADVLALTSDAENMPLSLLQGMAAGAACVATCVGGVPEMVEPGHDGLLVPPDDVEKTAEALVRLRDDAQWRDQLGAAARATAASRFSVVHTVDLLLDLYCR